MSRSTGVGALLTGMAIGATALFLSDEKNRAAVKAKLAALTNEAKEIGKEWKEDPDKAIAHLKKNASEIADQAKKSSAVAGKKLSAASKQKMIETLEETEKAVKSARTSLAAEESKTTAKKA